MRVEVIEIKYTADHRKCPCYFFTIPKVLSRVAARIFSKKESLETLIGLYAQAYEDASHLFEGLQASNPKAGSVRKEALRICWEGLDSEEHWHLLAAFPVSPIHFYTAEEIGLFGSVASTLPLSSLPTEPLIRFLFSKPFFEIKKWLEESIDTPSGPKVRLGTFSEEQKAVLLRRFHRYESALPLLPWMELLNVTEEQANKICHSENENVSCALKLIVEWRRDVANMKDFDETDPLSVFNMNSTPLKKYLDKSSIQTFLLACLLAMQETTICGERTYLILGNAPAASPLSAQDTHPLFVRLDGKLVPLFQSGLFNDFSIPTSLVSLQRNVIKRLHEIPILDWSSINIISDVHPLDASELSLEIRRLASHFRKFYPLLFQDPLQKFDHFDCSTLEPGSPERALQDLHRKIVLETKALTFKNLFKEMYQALAGNLQEITGEHGIEYDRDHSAHRNALACMSLLLLARSAKITVSSDIMDVSLSEGVSFHLKMAPSCEYKVLLEDNLGVSEEQLENLVTEYAFHTLSAITPSRSITPQMFQAFVDNIQALEEQSFYLLCLFCFSMLQHTEDEYLDTASYLSCLKEQCPSGHLLGRETTTILTTLVKNYVGSLDGMSSVLLPKSKVAFDSSGLETYIDKRRIPQFIHSLGNFASAICSKFHVYDTLLHDGNCAVNAFLMGLNGVEAYSKDGEREKLYADVRDFRKVIVDYASVPEHRAELAVKYPKKEGESEDDVTKLIERYNDASQTEWTSSIVWDIAAKVYGKTIHVYSLPGKVFSIDAQGEIEPTGIFKPDAETSLPPISLLYYGSVHYAAMSRRYT